MLGALVTLAAAAAAPAPNALDALTARTYEEYGRAAETIPFAGATIDRLTVLSRLGTEADPALRRRLFDALAPVRATIAARYDELIVLRRGSWSETPFEATARAWGIEPEQLEAWLVKVLEAWRDTLPEAEVEPWDLAWSAGAADRALASRLPKRRMVDVAVRYVTDLGAPPKELGIRLDIEPRRGKDPVAFTDFVRKPRRWGGEWSGGRYKVSASYREGGLGNLYELMHELGHAIHIAAIRPARVADVDWPDDDVFTEALADMIGVTAFDPVWQERYLGAAVGEGDALRSRLASSMLDICWALFEWRVHRDGAPPPNDVWTDLTHRYLRVAPHPEIPWWAVRGQLVDAPGYMMNYALGTILTENLRARVKTVRGPAAFERPKPGLYLWLAEQLYRFGKERPSRSVVESFLGGPIDPEELLVTISRSRSPN